MNLKQMTKIKDKETMIKELADLLALLPDEEVARMYLYINTWYLENKGELEYIYTILSTYLTPKKMGRKELSCRTQ